MSTKPSRNEPSRDDQEHKDEGHAPSDEIWSPGADPVPKKGSEDEDDEDSEEIVSLVGHDLHCGRKRSHPDVSTVTNARTDTCTYVTTMLKPSSGSKTTPSIEHVA